MAGEKYHDLQQTNFEWRVSVGGYRWLDKPWKILDIVGKPSKEQPPVLWPIPEPRTSLLDAIPEMTEDEFSGFKEHMILLDSYYPLEDETTLFQKFANLSPTREDIQAFANEYGLITQNLIVHENQGGLLLRTDSFETWVREIGEMKNVLDLWCTVSIAQGRDIASTGITEVDAIESLEKFWKRKPGNYINQTIETDDDRFYDVPLRLALCDADAVDATNIYILLCINAKLITNRVIPQVELEGGSQYIPYLVPENLLAAMWLQFYLWLTRNKNYKRCPVCGFWADTTGMRSDWKEHRECGARRRAKESYERKKKAAMDNTKNGR